MGWGGKREGAGRKTTDPSLKKMVSLPTSIWNKIENINKDISVQKNLRNIIEDHFNNKNKSLDPSNKYILPPKVICSIINNDEENIITKNKAERIFDALGPVFMNLKYEASKTNNKKIMESAYILEEILSIIDPEGFKYRFESFNVKDRKLLDDMVDILSNRLK